ncbi:TorF family putative porin [Arenicella sp. 4NH20-0111]
MKMKQFVLNGVALAVLAGASSAQAGDIEANVSLATDYVFRGFSQTNEELAIQGGFDYGFDNGFYIGTWASNVDFGSDTSTELDLYGGYAFDLAEGVSLDLSYIYFNYAGETDGLNYSEFVASLGFGDASLGLVYSPDYFGSDSSAIVLNGDYSFSLAENWSLDLHVGYTKTDDEGIAVDGDDYIDYSAGVSTSAGGLDLALTFYGTDVDDVDIADNRAVFSVSKSF